MATPNWDVPDSSQILYIKDNVGRRWKDLARRLGFSEPDIEGFEENKQLSERCMEMLTTWRQRKGNDGTVNILKEALEQAELKNIADELDDHKDPYPRGMNYRTVGDNQEVNEQDKHGMTQIRVGNWTASHETDARIQKAVEILLPALGPNFMVPSTVWQKGMRKFHPTVHGTQVCIENNATVARSRDSFNNSVCFSEMPIQVGEKVYLKVIDSRRFDEALRFGFTSEDPKTMTVEGLPQFSYPTLALQPGFWVKPLPASQAHQGCVVTFTLEESGNVTFAVDGEDKGLFFSGVDTSNPLWAVVDIHGSTEAVQFVGEQAAAEAFDKQIHEGDQVQVLVEDTETLRDMQNRHGGFDPDMSNLAKGEVGIVLRIDRLGVHVFFPSINKRWCITPAALRKVKRPDITAIIGGDVVKIEAGRKKLQSVQKKHHLWKKEMEKIKKGDIGRVIEVLREGQLAVRMAGEDTRTWAFHPKVVEKTAKQGDVCAQGLHHWRRGVSRTCVNCGECTAEGDRCSMKGKPLRSHGSCCGCSSEVPGCADCGFCWPCAGERAPPSSELNSLIFSKALAKTSSETQDENGLFKKGDLVRVLKDEEELKKLQTTYGGYTNECLGKIGSVKEVEGGQVWVRFLFTRPWSFNPEALTKVSSVEEEKPINQLLKAGDCVKVAVSAKRFNANQIGHGGIVDKMRQDMVMEKPGIVLYTDSDGDVFVHFQNGMRHLINPASLEKVNPGDYNDEDSSELKEGEWVKLDADKARIKKVQTGTVGSARWDDGYYATAGKVGRLEEINPERKIVCVDLGYAVFPLNCALVKRASLVDIQEHFSQSVQGSDFARGDLVKISVSLEELKGVQEGHGGFAANMEKVLAKDEAGSVCFIDHDGDVYVKFNTGKCIMFLNPTVLTKVTTKEDKFHVGDLVRIEPDLERFKSLQKPHEHGGYQEKMAKLCGKTGRLLSIPDDKKMRVKVQGRAWFFNPDALRSLGSPRADIAGWKSATICAAGKHNWSAGRCLVCVVCGECTYHGNLCPAPRRPDRTPGSVSGCGNGIAGCDDCGACNTCAGDDEEDLLERGKLHKVIMETIQKTLTEEVGKRLALRVDNAKTVVAKHRQSESGEEEVEMREILALLDNVGKTIQLMKSKNLDQSISEVRHATSQLTDLLLVEGNPAIIKQLGDYLANIGAAKVLLEYARFLLSRANQNDDNDGKLQLLKDLYYLVEQCTNASLQFGHAMGRSGYLLMTVQELARRQEMEASDDNQEWMHILISIVGSCARVPENLEYFRDIRAVDLLKKLKKEADMPLRVSSLRCLAYIADAEDPDLTQLQADDVDFFMNILNTAVSDAKHEATVGTQMWIAIDLVKDLHAFSRYEGAKQMFVSKGAMKPLIQLIEGGNDMEKEYAMLCVQSFAMVDSIRETIVSETRVEAVLRALLTQEDQLYAVLATARKTLKCLGKEPVSSMG